MQTKEIWWFFLYQGQTKWKELSKWPYLFPKCRRLLISQHFDERWENADCQEMCDHCHSSKKASITKDVTVYAQTVIQIILKALDVQVWSLKSRLHVCFFVVQEIIYLPPSLVERQKDKNWIQVTRPLIFRKNWHLWKCSTPCSVLAPENYR